MSDLVVESASESGLKKTAVIRGFLQGLIDRGELDLFKPVSNSTLRGWAEELKQKYGQDFNVNTISSVLRDLRLANSYKVDRELVGAESEIESEVGSKVGSESEVKSESVESEGASSPEPSGVGSTPESSEGSGGDAVTSWLFLAGLGALFALGVLASYYLNQNK